MKEALERRPEVGGSVIYDPEFQHQFTVNPNFKVTHSTLIFIVLFSEQKAARAARPAETTAAAHLWAAGWRRRHQRQVSGRQHSTCSPSSWAAHRSIFISNLLDEALTERWNATPSRWALSSWNMWIWLACCWKLRMTKMRKFLRTSELTSAPWWPISSSVCQVVRWLLHCCFLIHLHTIYWYKTIYQ